MALAEACAGAIKFKPLLKPLVAINEKALGMLNHRIRRHRIEEGQRGLKLRLWIRAAFGELKNRVESISLFTPPNVLGR